MSNWPDYKLFDDDDVKTQVAITYWLNRMIPITQKVEQAQRNTYFIMCNRVGNEFGNDFVGSSCVIKLKPRVEFHEYLSCTEENAIVA